MGRRDRPLSAPPDPTLENDTLLREWKQKQTLTKKARVHRLRVKVSRRRPGPDTL
jgi:hypothetical protein